MKKVTVNENQAVLMFKDGRFIKILQTGTYRLWGNVALELYDIKSEILSDIIDPEDLMDRADAKDLLDVLKVRDNEIAVRFLNGLSCEYAGPGTHLYFKKGGKNEFRIFSTEGNFAPSDMEQYAHMIPSSVLRKVTVISGTAGVLYINGKLETVLDAGTHYIWVNNRDILVKPVNMNVCMLEVPGQEILTADKVPLRITYTLDYKIEDAVKVLESTEDYKEQIYSTIQLALRELIGTKKLDEILEGKNMISDQILGRLKESLGEFYIRIVRGGIRDIILPGAVRDIMSTVLIAEKKAQANVITRREEVASTRSLLNTAKLMEENPTLYKLKELEYIEHIFDKVGNVNIGPGGIIDQLTGMIRRQ